MSRGKLIVMEGPDGCGKTKQCEMLVDHMRQHGAQVWYTQEYTRDRPIGQLIGKYLSKELEGDEKLINMLYAADRLDHVVGKGGILEHLNAGETVVTDRFYLSSLAYWTYPVVMNAGEFNIKLQEIITWNHYTMDIIKPDLTIRIEAPVPVLMERLNMRVGDPSVFEDVSKITFISQAYVQCARWCSTANHEDIIRIDGDDTPEGVHNKIWGCMKAWAKLWKEHEGEEWK